MRPDDHRYVGREKNFCPLRRMPLLSSWKKMPDEKPGGQTESEEIMKKIVSTAMAMLAVSAIMTAAPAEARQGCGVGFHRGPQGVCRPNRPVVVVRPGVPAIGVYQPGRGYWDGRRYWAHRYWHRGGWRYR